MITTQEKMITKDGDTVWLIWYRFNDSFKFVIIADDRHRYLDYFDYKLGSEEISPSYIYNKSVQLSPETLEKWKQLAHEKIDTDEFLQKIKEAKRTYLAEKMK